MVSSNTVGYQKITLTAGNYTLVSPTFEPVGGGEKRIKEIFAEDSFVAADNAGDADYIDLWEGGGYSRTYFFSSDAGDAWSDAQDGFDETDDTIPAGLGFWFYHHGSPMKVTLPVPYSL